LKSVGGDDGNLVFQSKGTETARINTDKQIVAAAGTASLPALTTTGDVNTGIFFPAADTAAIATGGTERMRVNSSGRVGVATTTPDSGYAMTVQGIGVDNSSQLYLKRQGNPQGLFITAGGGSATYDSYEGNDVVFGSHIWTATKGSTTTERMRIDGSGNLQFNSGYGSVATAFGCRAWVNFDGTGTPAIRASGNVSSITDNGTGDYTINFTTAMPDANYCVTTTSGNGNGRFVSIFSSDSNVQAALATGSVRVQNAFQIPDSPSRSDTNHFSVAIFR
jgi:hypothetical protein